MNKRKIIKVEDYYMALKLSDNDWEKLGRKYSDRGLVSLFKGKTGIEFIISDKIREELRNYITKNELKRIYKLFKYWK